MDSPTARLLVGRLLPALAVAITVFAAFYQLSESPAVWYDEGFFEQAAMNLAAHGVEVMQLAPNHYLSSWSISAGYPLIAPMALLFKWFGASVFTARLVPVSYLILFVIAAYWFVRRESGPLYAVIVALLLASFPLLYGNGKSVLGEVPALFYFALMLLSLQSLERSAYKNNLSACLTGFFAGLAFAAKFTFMLVPAALVIVFLMRRRTLFRELDVKGWVLGVTAFVVPVFIWVMTQFRPGDSLGSIVQFFLNPYDYSSTTLHSIVSSNLLQLLTGATPLYMLAIFVGWSLALLIRRRAGTKIPATELTAYFFTILVVLAYLRTNGWYRYFFPGMVAGLLYLPQSVVIVWTRLTDRLPFLNRISGTPYIALAFLILLQFYQLGWNSYVAEYYASTRTADLSAYFSKLDPEQTVFLYNVPEVAVFLPNKNFYQYLNPVVNQHFGTEELPRLVAGEPDVVVANTESYEKEKSSFTRYAVKAKVSHYVVLVPAVSPQ